MVFEYFCFRFVSWNKISLIINCISVYYRWYSVICEVPKSQEQSVDKRLFHMSVSPTLPPSREGFGARNMANVQLNFELWITNYELFYRICYRTCFLLIRLKCWILIFEQICFIGQSIYILQRPTDIYCDEEISALPFSTRLTKQMIIRATYGCL